MPRAAWSARLRSPHAIALWCLAAAGCHGYAPRPLEPESVLEAIARFSPDRAVVSRDAEADPPVSFAECAAWMREHGPGVQEAIAAYRSALARAAVDTPLPNPGLQVGPLYGFGGEIFSNRVVPFGSLGLTFPLGGRLGWQDELNRALAELARIDGIARHRELYLELRRAYSELVIARERSASREELFRAAEETTVLARRLVEAGQGTALDVALFELERWRARARFLESQAVEGDALARLASLVGVRESTFAALEPLLAALPSELPSSDRAREILLENHPELARLRARYESSDAALRLEIAEQYPDLRLGPSASGEVGEGHTILGLAIGIDLPIFDRNQQAVAEAEAQREEACVRYESAAKRALAELDRALRSLRLASERHALLRDSALPQARDSIRIARQSLAAGSGDALRLLDTERSHRQLLVEALDAELAARSAWVDLERAVGRPLFSFSGETAVDARAPGDLAPGEDASGEGREEVSSEAEVSEP